jgi:subtilisin family serine protease
MNSIMQWMGCDMNTNIRVRGGLDTRRVQSGKIGRRQPGLPLSRVALAMAGLFASASVLAAHIDPAELAQLESQASRAGVVRVMVSLDNSVTLEAMHNNLPAVRSAMQQKANTLLTELGDDAWDVAQWQNGVGQMGVYVNAAGLKKLAASKHAVAFMPDSTHAYRIRVSDSDGSLDEVEQAIDAKGYADVEVLLNVEGDYDIDKHGNSVFRPSAALLSEISDKLRAIGARKFAGNLRNLITPAAKQAQPEPTFKVRLDRKAFYALREDTDVRAIRLVGFKDKRQAHWPAEVLERAKAEGSADVIISLRGSSAYSPKGGFMSAAAWKAQGKAHGRVFDEILLGAGTTRASLTVVDHEGIGSMHVQLPYKALARLYANADARVLGVKLNRLAATASLLKSTSSAQTNMVSAWNAGYKAAGQNIVIMDSGVRKDHQMFVMNGRSKVTYEACFGTTRTEIFEGVTYSFRTICPPGHNTSGDSMGVVGSGEPWGDISACNDMASRTINSHDCSHGTHVAGIAAGRKELGRLQGVAPDASIIAVQLFSYDAEKKMAAVFGGDILDALSALQNVTQEGVNNPYVVNLSIGSAGANVHSSDCIPPKEVDLTATIKNLASRNIPVVAPTGNNANRNGIAWPACVKGVVKVAAVSNDSTSSFGQFSNLGKPSMFTGPIYFAPGGSIDRDQKVVTQVESAGRASPAETKLMYGTSQAAPHVAGVFAALKAAGFDLPGAIGWINGTGSVAMTIPLPSGAQTYQRIRIPNF